MKKYNQELQMYRMASLFGAILYPLTGSFFFDYYSPSKYDGFVPRILPAAVCLLPYIATYIKQDMLLIRVFVMIAATTLTGHFYYCAYLSNYAPLYLTGTVQLPFIILVTFYNKVDAIIYFCITLLLGFFILKNYPMDKTLEFVQLVTYLLVYYAFLSNRKKTTDDLNDKVDEIEKQKKQIEIKNQSLVSIGELAMQVAHDIRSPISALRAVSQSLGDIEPKKRQLIERASTRINDIADYLIAEYRTSLTLDLSSKKIERAAYLNDVINEIIDEKKITHAKEIAFGLFSSGEIRVPEYLNLVEFKRILSNLINNSIEALNIHGGAIKVSLNKSQNIILICIEDNGSGIPTESINKIFNQGTSNKQHGTGLGLWHAKKYLDSVEGKIYAQSQLNVGTKIFMELKN